MSICILRETITITNGAALGLPKDKRSAAVAVPMVGAEMSDDEWITESDDARVGALNQLLKRENITGVIDTTSVIEVLTFDQVDSYGELITPEGYRSEPTSIRLIGTVPAMPGHAGTGESRDADGR